MSILYGTGARVQELIDIRVCDVILENPAVIILTGKGNKITGMDLNKIRCWLGYVSVNTTNRYIEINLQMKKHALDIMPHLPTSNDNRIVKNEELLAWLESL